jgi:hypothetical protein
MPPRLKRRYSLNRLVECGPRRSTSLSFQLLATSCE